MARPGRVRMQTVSLTLFLAAISLLPTLLCAPPRCLQDKAATRPRRYLSYNGTTMNITLQVSRRLPHRLSTAALQIFLSDVLGYEDVVTVPEPASDLPDIVRELSAVRPNGRRTVPPAIANLEVLVEPDTDFMYYLTETTVGTVVPYGDLVPPVRRGWYIPEALHRPEWEAWTIFTDPALASHFDLKGHEKIFIEAAMKDDKRFFCEESYCINGTYTPMRCSARDTNCAVLLTTHPDETGFVARHIDELNMYVKVVWLGPNLPRTIDALVARIGPHSENALVFLDWAPSHTEMAGGRYVSLIMPRCDDERAKIHGCQYELTRVLKFGWNQLPRQASRADKTFQVANFSLSQYEQLIANYKADPRKDVYSAACQWMKTNRDTWNQWISRRKEEITIGGIFPFTGSASHNAFGIITAVKMAVDAINKDSSVLEDYVLAVHQENGECRAETVMKRFIDYILGAKEYDKLIGMLGPACSETLEPLAGVSKHYRTPVISYSAEGMNFEDRSKYPYVFRTIGGNRQFKHVYYNLMSQLGWKRVAALTEDGQKHTEYISYMENFLVSNGVEFVANVKFPKDDMNVTLPLYLEELRNKRARLIIADVDEATARTLMCTAHGRGMTASDGYVWFLPPWLPAQWYDAPAHNTLLNETVPCSLETMLEAINGHFSIGHAPFAEDRDVMQEKRNVGEWKKEYAKQCEAIAPVIYLNYRQNPYLPANGDIRSPYAGYAYDAVWTYALAFDKLLKNHPAAISDLHHDMYTNLFVKYIGETNFNGVSGNIRFRGGSSRFSPIIIMQWINNSSTVVGKFHPNISKDKPDIIDGYLDLNLANITWFTEHNTIPDDGAETCTFQGLVDVLNVDCHQAFVIFNVLIFSGLAALLIAAFFYFKRRFERNYEKQMLSMGLNILTPSKIASLDKWEIPRERIVINRKLGMGAFGTVYGGHALLCEEKGWTAVAVKTIKVGSSTDAKLDFLSEAEAMKRFDHKNIVKLLGVTTKTEPVCTVMEFMLYGDLKNYLLSRRHLVNERDSEESDEVSSRKLTSMALDVARALSYLADLNYVHRDVACRNCLVNSHRVIKLGDFGMTRLIFENDYYRFSRKGMLPVRWMAPESLGMGIFSQASDVWSFGVLLYEIITFGSLPFQGLSNSEVLQHVKNGGTVILPPGVKPQLEGLIKTCWNMDYKSRPHASAVAEFLANNPRLLSPCLDTPLDSMSLDDSAQWRLLPEVGKVSVGMEDGKPHLLPSELSSAAFSTSPLLANSTSTNLTYVSTDLSLNGQTRDYPDVFDDEKTSFLT